MVHYNLSFKALKIVQIAVFLLSVVVLSATAYSQPISLPQDGNGWTIFTPSADSRIIYLSSTGNNSTGKYYSPQDSEIGNDPFNPTGPIQSYSTYAAAYTQTRNGYPDWILIKRGDTFIETIGNQIRDGRNAQEPFVIAAYGDTGLSPVFKTGTERALHRLNTGIEWFAISGISFAGSAVGGKRLTALPFLSTRNLVKFHLIFSDPIKPFASDFSALYIGCAASPFTSILENIGNVTP